MMMRKYLILTVLTCLCLGIVGCQKEFLEKKTDKGILVPVTLNELQSLLDNTSLMNKVTGMQLLAGDELQPTDNGWQAFTTPEQRNAYIWADDLYEGRTSTEWNTPFQQVLVSNIVLEGAEKMVGSGSAVDELRGAAYFYRAMAYHSLAEKFTRPYTSSTASQEMGLPYHLEADVNARPGRGSLEQTYLLMIADLEKAAELLPLNPIANHRPSKKAANGLLARLYLLRQQYDLALEYAERVLSAGATLVDLNTRNVYADANGNVEVIFNSGMLAYGFLNSTLSYVHPALISSYQANDLRLAQFFVSRGNNNYTLTPAIFSQNLNRFGGIALDEMYLIRAEVLVRSDRVDDGLDMLNQLLVKRYRTGTFVPYSGLGKMDALKLVLSERKKELMGRGLRWSDLRRLNLEPNLAQTLVKTVKGVEYRLEPNSGKYVFPIPDAEIALSGIPQNRR